MSGRTEHTGNTGNQRTTAFILAGVVAGMLGLSYAAVPLYQLFCQVTGFGGTTQKAEKAPDHVLARQITVRFDANVAQSLAWRFRPVQNTVILKIGESVLAFYEAENQTKADLHGTATFNVTPEIAGAYFSKIECFCFTEQTLKPGERVDMPVTFFVDPEIMNDPDAKNIKEITLSYTFFPAADEPDVASAPENEKKGRSLE